VAAVQLLVPVAVPGGVVPNWVRLLSASNP
jgi:hypothetical protein